MGKQRYTGNAAYDDGRSDVGAASIGNSTTASLSHFYPAGAGGGPRPSFPFHNPGPRGRTLTLPNINRAAAPSVHGGCVRMPPAPIEDTCMSSKSSIGD